MLTREVCDGGAATIVTPARFAAPARRLAVGAAVGEAVAAEVMRKRLGELGEPYTQGGAGHFRRAGGLALAAGAALMGLAGRSRPAAIGGGSLVMAGALLARASVFSAGRQSAADPKYTVGPQRARIERGDASWRGPSRRCQSDGRGISATISKCLTVSSFSIRKRSSSG